MNFLFIDSCFLPDGQTQGAQGSARVTGPRVAELLEDHDLKAGLTLAVAVENLGSGKAKIESLTPDKVDISFTVTKPPPLRQKLDVMVGYVRPQTTKKLLQFAAAFGLRSLSFVQTAQVVPSYLQSKSLQEAAVRRQLVMGCEQGGDSVLPMIKHYTSLHSALRSSMVKQAGLRFLGVIDEAVSTAKKVDETLLFIGPESGLLPEETSEILEQGFITLSLGPRMLRVEQATSALVGAIVASGT